MTIYDTDEVNDNEMLTLNEAAQLEILNHASQIEWLINCGMSDKEWENYIDRQSM